MIRIVLSRLPAWILPVAMLTTACLVEFPPRIAQDVDAPEPPSTSDAEAPRADVSPPDVGPGPDAERSAEDATVLADARPVVPASLRIEPAQVNLRIDQTFDVRAVLVLPDGTEGDRTAEAVWAIADPDVAVISSELATPGRLYPLALGQTTLLATVGELISDPVPVQVTPLPGSPPVARLSCPETGEAGEPLRFDASRSSDPDGMIVAWLFDFGDGSEATSNGTEATVEHVFATPGRYKVLVTVVDATAASAATSCMVDVGADGAAPVVRLIAPDDGLEVEPGETFAALIDARAGDGRDIAEVTVILDGALVGVIAELPYRVEITVPADVVVGAVLPLVAQARDDLGVVGTSDPVSVVVGAK